MKLTPKIQKAINVSAEKHAGQKRRSSGQPFIVHPFAVAFILSEFTRDEDVIIAGLLHDTIEDTNNYTFYNIKKDFGITAARIVREVSDNKNHKQNEDPKDSWETRKKNKIKQLKKASNEALMVVAADHIHNLKCLIKEYNDAGDEIWQNFNASPEKKFQYYREVLVILEERLNCKLVKELNKTHREAESVMINIANQRSLNEQANWTDEFEKFFFKKIRKIFFD